jgi:hypothetical protein
MWLVAASYGKMIGRRAGLAERGERLDAARVEVGVVLGDVREPD